MPHYAPRRFYLRMFPDEERNMCWEHWRKYGYLLGIPLIFFGLALSVLEIVRILDGPTHKGISNFNADDSPLVPAGNFRLGAESLLFNMNANQFPRRYDKHHYFFWTYAANLFSIVAILAGIAGIVSAHRQSYRSIYTFHALSWLTLLFSGFLIGYYSVLTNYYNSRGLANPINRPDTMDISYALVATNLSISCVLFILGLLGILATCLGIKVCMGKGYSQYNTNYYPMNMMMPILNTQQQAPFSTRYPY